MREKWSYLVSLLMIFICAVSACEFLGIRHEDRAEITLTESQEPPSLDSVKSMDVVSFRILNNIMEGLMRYGKEGELVLGMAAEKPIISTDGKTYLFKIRDASWSDGKPVTAQDFEFAWKRALAPGTASELSYLFYVIDHAKEYNTSRAEAGDVGVKAIDMHTLRVTLCRPIPYFLDLLAIPVFLPQREEVVRRYSPVYALEADKMVCNGPFVLSSWNHGKGFQYRKNMYYWDRDVVKLKKVNTVIVKDPVTSLNLYRTGKVDYTELGSEFIEQHRNHPELFMIKDMATFFLQMNQRMPIFKNEKIRRSIMWAIDRDTLTKNILKNGSTPAGCLLPPEMRKRADRCSIPYDPRRARVLWKEGLKECGIAKVKPIELVGDDSSWAKGVLTFVGEQLRMQLGIPVQVVSIPLKQRLERGRAGHFDILLSGRVAQYNDRMTFLDLFTTESCFNWGRWSNSHYDQLVRSAIDTMDFTQRERQLKDAAKLLTDQAGIIPLYYKVRSGLIRSYIKGWIWNPIGSENTLKWVRIEK